MSSVLAVGVLVVGLGSPAAAAEQTPDSPLSVATSEQQAELHQSWDAELQRRLREAQARKADRWRHAGIGLLAVAGVLNTAGLSLNIVFAKELVDDCRQGWSCDTLYDLQLGYAVPAAGLNLLAVGFAAGGGHLLRRHDTWNAGETGIPTRKTRNLSIAGGVLLGVGLVSAAVAWTFAMTNPHPLCDFRVDQQSCALRLATANVVEFQLSALAASAGAGMLAYGITPRPKRRERRRHSFHAAPMLGRSMGLSIAGAF